MKKLLKILMVFLNVSTPTLVLACNDLSKPSVSESKLKNFENNLISYFQNKNIDKYFYEHNYSEIQNLLDNFLVENNLKGTAKFMFASDSLTTVDEFVEFDTIKLLGTILKSNLVLFWDEFTFININLFDNRPLFSELSSNFEINNSAIFDSELYANQGIFDLTKAFLKNVFVEMNDQLGNKELVQYLQTIFNISEEELSNYLLQQLNFNLNYFNMSTNIISGTQRNFEFEINELEKESSWFNNTFFKFDNYSDGTTTTNVVVQKKVVIDNALMYKLETQYKIGQNNSNPPVNPQDDMSLDLSQKNVTNLDSAMPFIYEYVINWLNVQFEADDVIISSENIEIKILKALSGDENFWNNGWSLPANIWEGRSQVSAITKGTYFGATRNILNVTIMSSNSDGIKVVNDGPAKKLAAFHLPVIL